MRSLGVILAGGRASRMDGEDKGLIIYQGRPLIEWVIDCLAPHVDQIVVVANRNLEHYSKHCKNVITDAHSKYQGPLVGILSAMQWYGTRIDTNRAAGANLIVTPCDTPNMPTDFVTRLVSGKDQLGTSTRAVYADDGRHRHPLHALLDVGLELELANFLAANKNGAVYKWLHSINAKPINFSDRPDAFVNMNTWSDLQHKSQYEND